jgi:hypothetical protein
MVEVFYRINVPEEQRDEKTEYYTLTYMFVPLDSFVVMQIHGWWDEESNHSRCETTVLATVAAEVEAKRIYGEQRIGLLGGGFVNVCSGLWTTPAPASARGLVEV